MESRAVMHMERRRGGDRRQTPRLQRSELGRMASRIRALAAVARERDDHVAARIADLEREMDRVLERVGLEPLPPSDV